MLVQLAAALEAAAARIEQLQERLDGQAGGVHPDDVGRVRALAEDALARADHALARTGDALARVESLGADALARADHALARSGDAVAKAESLGSDALARADHALARSGDAVAKAESLGSDGIARADHALERAGDAVAKAESLGADAVARADHAFARAEDAATQAGHAVDAAREGLLPASIAALAGWLELCPPLEELLVSIVLPTRDRHALLPRAVASALEQLYGRWELIVVEDGDTGAVADVLAPVEDDRIATVEGPRRGLGAARNAGLDSATGDVVCYLDDDNVMHPAWLQAVAHVFSTREDVDVLYGVTLAEHRVPGTLEDGWWPAFWQKPWAREGVLRENVTDAGAIAHRRELAGARFDEALESGEDWDLLIRLTSDRPALAVPAISHAYATEGNDRMSRALGHRAALEDIRRRHGG